MRLYTIQCDYYNHVSGYGSFTNEVMYEDFYTAKREMLKMAMADENLWEYDAEIKLADDLESVRCEGGRDYSEYYINEADISICKDKSDDISNEEIKEMLDELGENVTITCVIGG